MRWGVNELNIVFEQLESEGLYRGTATGGAVDLADTYFILDKIHSGYFSNRNDGSPKSSQSDFGAHPIPYALEQSHYFSNPKTPTPFVVPIKTFPLATVGVMNLFPLPK